jgi:hypothetical protein
MTQFDFMEVTMGVLALDSRVSKAARDFLSQERELFIDGKFFRGYSQPRDEHRENAAELK